MNDSSVATIEHAPFSKRLAAFVIDLVILGAAEFFVWATYGLGDAPFGGLTQGLDPWWETTGILIVQVAGAFMYFVLPYSTTGQTPGKRLLGLRVVAIDGSELTWLRGSLRALGGVTSSLLFGLGYWSALWDRDGQTWHDKMASTTVTSADKLPATMLSRVEAARRQRRWLVGLALPTLGACAIFLFPLYLNLEQGAVRKQMTRWVEKAATAREAVSLDLSSLNLELAEVRDLRDDQIPGSYSSGAVAMYRWRGTPAVWLAAVKYDSPAQREQDREHDMDDLLRERYCPGSTPPATGMMVEPGTCQRTITGGSHSFSTVMAGHGPASMPLDVAGAVGKVPPSKVAP
jgi:uncharacterized RDD family membrane protein YckC